MAQRISHESAGPPVDPDQEPDIMTTTEVCDRYWLDRRVLYRIEQLKWFRKPVPRTQKGVLGNGHKEHLYDREHRQTIRMVVRLQGIGLSEASIAQVLGLPPENKTPNAETIVKLLAADDLDNAWRVELRAFLTGQLARIHGVQLGPVMPLRRTKGPAARSSPLERLVARTMESQTKMRTRRDAPKKRRRRPD